MPRTPRALRRLTLALALLIVAQAVIAAGAIVPPVAVAQEPTGAALTQLEAVLNPDGTLMSGLQLDGSIDTSGWEMVIDADGTPRFVQEGAAQAAPQQVSEGAWVGGAIFGGNYSEAVAVNPEINSVAIVGDDLYVGGTFSRIGDAPAASIARWNRMTQQWHSLGSGITRSGTLVGTVYVITLIGRELFVGGDFDSPGRNLARWNLDTNSWTGLSVGTLYSGVVYDIKAGSGPDVYVAGEFSTPGQDVARYDRSTGQWDSMGYEGGDTNSAIGAIFVAGDSVFVGGEGFEIRDNEKIIWAGNCGGRGSCNIGVWNRSTGQWAGLGTGIDGQINDMALIGDEVIVGGSFTRAGTSNARSIARWDLGTTTWSSVGGGLGNGAISTMAAQGDNLYIGGDFTSVGGIAVKNVARWNTSTLLWSAMGNGLTGEIRQLTIDNTGPLAVGAFQKQPGIRTNNIVRWDTSANIWLEIGGYDRYRDTPLNSLLTSTAGVFSFDSDPIPFVAGQAAGASYYAPAYSYSNGWYSPYGADYLHGSVFALAKGGDSIYFGGLFTNLSSDDVSVRTLTYKNIVEFPMAANTTTIYRKPFQPLGTGTNGPVDALALDGTLLYAGGRFSEAGGAPANNIARWHTALKTWSPLGSGVNGDVYAIAVSGSDVYVGGRFSQAGGVAAGNIARWNSLTEAWSAVGSGVDGPVEAITVVDGLIYVGGGFAQAGGSTARGLALWNGNTWREVAGGVRGNIRTIAHARDARGDFLYVGGAFDRAGALAAANIARLDRAAESWQTLGSGTAGTVETITVAGSNVIVGGQFDSAGGVANTQRLARYTFNPIPRITSITPSQGRNDQSTAITVVGSGFSSSPSVTFRGQTWVIPPAPQNDTQFNTSIPPDPNGIPCDYRLSVRNSDGEVGSRSFKVLAAGPPAVLSATPLRVTSGATINLSGRNIVCGSTVRIGGVLAGYSAWYNNWPLSIPTVLADGTYDLSITGPNGTTTVPNAIIVGAPTGSLPIDVTISLYNNPTGTQRVPYEAIVRNFADGLFEQSNGAHQLRNVTFHTNQSMAGQTDIQWIANCWPNAHVSGRGVAGLRVEMCDQFGNTNFLIDTEAGGYVLAHEWGHFYYSLYDEYRGGVACDANAPGTPCNTDTPVPNSIMHSQWQAQGGNFAWLNFSTANTNTGNTAQHRVYGTSGWATLTRPVVDDPRTGILATYPVRLFYSELSPVAPAANQAPQIDLVPNNDARDALQISWVGPGANLAATDSIIAMMHMLGGTQVVYPNPIQLLATLQREQMIAGAVPQGELIDPDGAFQTFPLRDDGVAPDLRADDGIYVALIDYQQDGPYTIRVRFSNSAGTAREISDSGQLTAPPPGETPAIPSPRPISDPFAVEAELRIQVSGVQADDHSDAAPQATILPTTNVDTRGKIDRPGDRDLFKVTPDQSGRLVIRVSGLALGAEPRLRLLAEDGTTELANVVRGSTDDATYLWIAQTVTIGNTIYAEVSDQRPASSGGLYQISAGAPLDAEGGPAGAPNRLYLPLIAR